MLGRDVKLVPFLFSPALELINLRWHQVGLPGFDSMPSALTMLSKQERASYCNHYWEQQFKKVSVLEFTRDRKMMSVLCSRKQQEILFCKGAPESIFSRCTSVLCNDDGSAAPMTAEIRAELEERLIRYFV
jgi:Ca2+ transporting ATPase